jgi:hypothetical protein
MASAAPEWWEISYYMSQICQRDEVALWRSDPTSSPSPRWAIQMGIVEQPRVAETIYNCGGYELREVDMRTMVYLTRCLIDTGGGCRDVVR